MAMASISEFEFPGVIECQRLSRERFENTHLSEGKPVIIRGLCDSWPSVTAAKQGPDAIADYVSRLDSGARLNAFVAPPSIRGRYFYNDTLTGLNFQQVQTSLTDAVKRLLAEAENPEPPCLYAGASASDNVTPGFAAQNPMPLLDSDIKPLIWTGNRSRIAPHFDASDNIACVVSGKRAFLLFPPEQIADLYVGPLHQTIAGQPTSMVDPREIDFTKYPKFRNALENAQLAELHPGDALFIPSMWWHYVEADGPLNILANYWWNNRYSGNLMDTLALALMTLRDVPTRQRAACATLFDHYVFGDTADDAGTHLPPHAQGPLAPASPERDAMIKAYLRARLGPLLR